MKTLALVLEYCGKNYSGWQIQPNGRTIQEELQTAYKKLTGISVNFVGSGRTDAGVHAKAQVATANIEFEIIPENKLCIALNTILPDDIKINKAIYTNILFNARFDALDRKYQYYLSKNVSVFEKDYTMEYRLPFDEEKLNDIAQVLLGTNDFTTFSKVNEDIKNNVCIIKESRWELKENKLVYHIRANHFLYGMVRSLVGVMLDYARGKRIKEEILFALKSKDRQKASPLVPSRGLYLVNVNYNEEINKLLYS